MTASYRKRVSLYFDLVNFFVVKKTKDGTGSLGTYQKAAIIQIE